MKPFTPTPAQAKQLAETGRIVEWQVCDPQPEIVSSAEKDYHNVYGILVPIEWPSMSFPVWSNHSLCGHSPFGATGELYTWNDITLRATVTLERREQVWGWCRVLEKELVK